MKLVKLLQWTLGIGITFSTMNSMAENPIIRDQFTADPTARVFGDKIYLFPSHDIPAPQGVRQGWFCMEDYHVFSSDNLVDWKDHGVIVTQNQVLWLDSPNYDMWAPDCVFKNGKYYFYFPVGGRIGVAVADKPEGPYKIQYQPVVGAGGIDPCVLMDKDGSAYLFTAMGRISCVKLKDNMLETDGQAVSFGNLNTDKGLIEGPFAFERNGKYYLTYPHATNKERLEYAMSDNPMGPYTYAGDLMDESPSGCWTNHQSIVQFKGQWYLFYHDKDYSPTFDKNRSTKIDLLNFNADGTIQKVIPTNRGVGISEATSKLQIDRFSAIDTKDTTVTYLNVEKPFDGWKTTFTTRKSWVRYNAVSFESGLKMVNVQAKSPSGGTISIRLDKPNAAPIAKVKINKTSDFKTFSATLKNMPKGKHDIIVTLNGVMLFSGRKDVEIDWIQFQ
jgi:beta-xylosidase